MTVLWVHQKHIPFLLLAQVDLEHPEFRYLLLPLWWTQKKFNQTTSCTNFSFMQSWQSGRAIFYSSPNNETYKKIAGRWALLKIAFIPLLKVQNDIWNSFRYSQTFSPFCPGSPGIPFTPTGPAKPGRP